ncbi:hypothetical protein VTN77DRAFT_8715 [Rasamsonia byssochlamydoides]|uniref:uncharacterized protein n=1 Tax=Rasamsonia byssochlamydoides TaxID=89139 RepID=UPI0037449016
MADSTTNSSSGRQKTHACVLCQKRKVKCDRNDPCSGCVKAQVECVFREPLPPRRRKKKSETIHVMVARLKRYEEVLKKNGIDPRVIDGNSENSVDSVRHDTRVNLVNSVNHGESTAVPNPFESNTREIGPGRLITKEGRSIYLDNNLWKNASNELQDAEDMLPESSDDISDQSLPDQSDGIDLDENFLVFGSSSRRSLAGLHPNPIHIFKLWQIFLESVNPLTKIIHAPTVQQRILDATSDLSSVPKELEALMFAIYSAALTALSDEEVTKIFGETKARFLARCRQGAQQALINAGILKTSDMVVLQAFVIFLLSVRLVYNPHALWSLSGIAVRVAQRIGLHRDGSHLGLSVFETELRRRLWWQVVVVDATIGHMSGSISSLLPVADTNTPLNVNDSDLYPDMKERPVEHPGATEMIFCLMRYELGKWLYRQASSRVVTFDGHWGSISSASVPLQEKDRAIDELENALEEKFVKHCDPSIPLHLMTMMVAKSVVGVVRLMAHHPRHYQERGERMPQFEKDRLFAICMDVAEYGTILQTTKTTQRYLWHVNFQWDPLIYMLSELRYRTVGEETAKAWHLIDGACTRYYQQLGPKARSPLHLAIGHLAVKAWSAHVAECERRQLQPLPRPEIITIFSKEIQRTKSSSEVASCAERHGVTTSEEVASGSFADYAHAPPSQKTNSNDFDPDITAMADTFSSDSPMDCDQWDDLLQQFQHQFGEDGFLTLGSGL